MPKRIPLYNAVGECWKQEKCVLLVSRCHPSFADLKDIIARHYRTRRFKFCHTIPDNHIMSCKRLCESGVLKDVIVPGIKHYGKTGIKKCRTCNKFFRVTDNEWKCPCCHFRLSTKPSKSEWKKRCEDPSYNGPLVIIRY